MVVVAHQDDEVLAAGVQFSSFGRLTLVHVTDGAPSSSLARPQSVTRASYRRARHDEVADALAVAGVAAERHNLGYRDLEVSFQMAGLARRLTQLIARVNPDVVFTHAFEGGHPDHDSVAFAVHWAVAQLRQPPELWELTGYHQENGRAVRGQFRDADDRTVLRFCLSQDDQDLKRRMLARFATQRHVVAQFPLTEEVFRKAPDYAFAAERAPDTVAYDGDGWQMDGRRWQKLVLQAQQQLAAGSQTSLLRTWQGTRVLVFLCYRRTCQQLPTFRRILRKLRRMARLG
jgi:LmbE family N-acetylglucosaminyl deacetylase